MARWFALVLWVLVSVTPAQAIVITEGSFSAVVLNDFSPFFNMHGEGFSVTGIDITGGNPLPFQMVKFENINRPVDISSTAQIRSRLGSHIVVVDNGTPFPDIIPGGVTFNGEFINTGILSGALTFDVEPFLLTATPSPGMGIPPTANGQSPFSMTGFLTFAGQTVELEGAGTLDYRGRGVGDISPFGLSFQFAEPVPEPATLTLLGLGGGALAVRRWWRRR